MEYLKEQASKAQSAVEGVIGGKPIALVTSATGRIGKEVVARLAAGGKFRVRAAAHNPAKAEYLKGLGADEIVALDLTDAATWTAVLDVCR